MNKGVHTTIYYDICLKLLLNIHDNVLSVHSAHTVEVFYLLRTTMDRHYKNVVTFGMCLRQHARVCV